MTRISLSAVSRFSRQIFAVSIIASFLLTSALAQPVVLKKNFARTILQSNSRARNFVGFQKDDQNFTLTGSQNIVISQVYGGGGNAGAPLRNDFVELFNRGNSAVSVDGWSVQYASATGTGNFASNVVNLSGSIAAGQYYLVQLAGGSNGAALPAPDATGTVNLSATGGKVALVNTTTGLACNGGSTVCSPEQLVSLIDLVGYGTANFFEGGGAAPAPSSSTADWRTAAGCTDTDNNNADFIVTAPIPRNTASPLNLCAGGNLPSLSINNISIDEGDAGATSAVFTISLSAPAGPGGVTLTAATADGTATVANNDYQPLPPTNFTIAEGSSSLNVAVLVNGDTAPEPNETFFLNITSVVGANVANNQGICTIVNDDVIITPIDQIQGDGPTSPLAGQTVTTRGIVTARRGSGFYLQTPDAETDANPNTSEGIFVFTNAAPPTAAAVGNLVRITATVVEFVPNSDPNQLPLTELSMPTVSLLSTNNSLPAPVIITAADTPPGGGLGSLEKYEGMRVRVDSLKVVAPTGGNVNEANATATSNGTFFGVVDGVARPFREPGVDVLDPLPAGAPANVPRFDDNPERIRVFSFGQTGSAAINVTTGAIVSNLVGVLDYGFRTYTIFPDPAATPTISGNISAVPVTDPLASEMTVASFNLERFFDTTNDPKTSEPVLTPAAFETRLNKASLAIRNILKTPDVLGVVEIENLSTLQTLANKINADAAAAGQANPNYHAFLEEGNDVGGIDVGFLVKSSRITVNAVTQYGKDATYTNPVNNQPDLLNDRPPLRLQATVQLSNGEAYPFSVIVNHLRSLSGIDGPEGVRIRAKRRAQAEFLANLVQGLQQANPTEPILLCGDFNAFQINDGYVDAIGTIKGAPAPADQVVLASPDLVNPDLINLVETLPAPTLLVTNNQAYSFVFDGNAQVLDHVLVTQNLQSRVTRFEYARLDADFPEVYRNDPARPERISDHDAPVAYISLLVQQAPEKVDLGGRIADAAGRSIKNAFVVLLNLNTGNLKFALTNSSGVYQFKQVKNGDTYLITPLDLRFRFNPSKIVVTAGSNRGDLDFRAQPRR